MIEEVYHKIKPRQTTPRTEPVEMPEPAKAVPEWPEGPDGPENMRAFEPEPEPEPEPRAYRTPMYPGDDPTLRGAAAAPAAAQWAATTPEQAAEQPSLPRPSSLQRTRQNLADPVSLQISKNNFQICFWDFFTPEKKNIYTAALNLVANA